VQVGSTAASGSITTATGSTNLGRRSYSGAEAYFNGTIDEVRIYNRALSAEEIQLLYTIGK
jgi:hypothetical protein